MAKKQKGKTPAPEKLRTGSALTAAAIAVILYRPDEKTVEGTRVQMLRDALDGSRGNMAAIMASIASTPKSEREKLQKTNPAYYGKAVEAMCKDGCSIESARVRVSNARTIIKAWRMGFTLQPTAGWMLTVKQATAYNKGQSERASKHAIAVERATIREEYLLDHPDDVEGADKYLAETWGEVMTAKLAKASEAAIAREVKRLTQGKKAYSLAEIEGIRDGLSAYLTAATAPPMDTTDLQQKLRDAVKPTKAPTVEVETA